MERGKLYFSRYHLLEDVKEFQIDIPQEFGRWDKSCSIAAA